MTIQSDFPVIARKSVGFSWQSIFLFVWIASCESAIRPRNDESILDSSLTAFAQNDERGAEVFLMRNRGCVATSEEIRLIRLLTKRVASLPDLSHPVGCEALAEAKKDKRAVLKCA